MRTLVLFSLPLVLLAAIVSCSATPDTKVGSSDAVVLVLVEDLTWREVQDTPALAEAFEEGAVANLSTTQGASPADPRMSYALLGASSRTDTSLLPESLPEEPAEVLEAFEEPAAGIQPGTLGGALTNAGLQTGAIGESARLVAMDREGEVSNAYDTSDTAAALEETLSREADFVAVEADNARQAGQLAEVAEGAGATVAVASPIAPDGSANLTPFALGSSEEGLLYSPATRTEGLITSADVAPTILAQLGVDPPPGMLGRAASIRPGQMRSAERLGERLSFVAEERTEVWVSVSAILVLCLLSATLWKGRRGARFILLSLAALPAAALVSAAAPITNVPAVVALILVLGVSLAALSWRLSGPVSGAVAGVYLVTAALILADAASGGTLMKLSTLGYNPAYGTRFYGIGNEYAAFLAGSLTVGAGALAHRRRLPPVPLLVVGLFVITVLGLPTMGADVGGSLALGFGFGATAGLLRGTGLRGLALWAGGGLAVAAALFLASGALFPGVSHGSRAAGGETDLTDIVVRKLLLSLDLLLNPVYFLIFAAGLILVFLGWRQTKGTALAAGLLGATITALASGALNDSGILATIYTLAYPAVAATIFLLSDTERFERSNKVR